ncbi:MAG: NAD(P)H-dependent oxidoreductase [Verrucomicrobiaceae bacterium]|nr:NAD(P)H-dependent oxidoreductase [Verrucomicrobiaceae bacterium]
MTTPEELISSLKWRYATKSFDPARKIPDKEWAALEESLVLTPSSFGLQPWKFLVVQDQAIREQLVPHSWGQRQVADCSHLVVMTVKQNLSTADVDAFVQRNVDVRGGSVEALKGYRDMMEGFRAKAETEGWLQQWAKLQAYIALGQLMAAAALLRIDACPMEGFVPAKFDEILNLNAEGLTTAVLCPLGYRSDTDKYAALPKVRFDRETVIEWR